ncbi:MAG: bifunctional phosphoribosylaminoimidazolecarboxamide formyltransferase/IMP cyclohydrolase [Bacteroidota bacterium]
MNGSAQIKSALISVFHKDGLEPIVRKLDELGVTIYSTGGTQKFIEERGIRVIPVEDLTTYPSILGGRVKTLHPKVFGGILGRRELEDDVAQLEEYEIPSIDLVVVDLYPFEATVAAGGSHQEIIEKIDIGGISLIRAAAKNFKDVTIVSGMQQYDRLMNILEDQNGETSLEDRQWLAAEAFQVSSHYDTMIFRYFDKGERTVLKESYPAGKALRYGENPHQQGYFFGQLDNMFDQLHGKELSYNNLLDIDAAVHLMHEFKDDHPTFAILKHNNACGLATRDNLVTAYKDALAGDPISAFGGILISNSPIDIETAEEINSLFCEVVIAPSFGTEALELLKSKKNRVLLVQKSWGLQNQQFRTILNGVLLQDRDQITDKKEDFKVVTDTAASQEELEDLEFANKLVKHTKSNTIVFAKGGQLLASGTGQTSRVDALKQAVVKAKAFGFSLKGAVMASDAFFPFPDCVELASEEGITAVIQPGGSIKDQLSIDFCNQSNMSMYFTGNRHFKH